MRSILALDLGTTTGWAVRDQEGTLHSGTWSIKSSRFEGGGMRYVKWEKELTSQMDKTPFESVYFEEVRAHKGTDAAHAYGGFLAILSSWCEKNKMPYQGVSVGAIKKFATGKGNATKDEMMAAAKNRGLHVSDHNEADAVALLFYALATFNQPPQCS